MGMMGGMGMMGIMGINIRSKKWRVFRKGTELSAFFIWS